MTVPSEERRLAAIMFTDIVGWNVHSEPPSIALLEKVWLKK